MKHKEVPHKNVVFIALDADVERERGGEEGGGGGGGEEKREREGEKRECFSRTFLPTGTIKDVPLVEICQVGVTVGISGLC